MTKNIKHSEYSDIISYDINKLSINKYKRNFNQTFSKGRISVTYITNNYLIAHLTNADLSMLSDFDKIKHELNIVHKSFVTLNKPILIDGVRVFVRDTMLISPAGKKFGKYR